MENANTLQNEDGPVCFSDDKKSGLVEQFREWVEDPAFPCVGAKSALALGQIETYIARDIKSGWDDVEIYRRLANFVADYRNEKTLFRSLCIIFANDSPLDEVNFESAIWERIQSLCDKDAAHLHRYDSRVSDEPENQHFSLSFAGEAFFVVGMHPGASRPARRFACPVMVFNLHDQFERLRNDGRYEKMRATILNRDLKLAGSVNPMLTRFGDKSEARQYSGRAVGDNWICPFDHTQREKYAQDDFATQWRRISDERRANVDRN